MKPVEQRQMAIFDENGDNIQRGDCLTACVASILELPLDEVPFFVESDNWWNDYLEFFRGRGFLIERAFMTVDSSDPTKLSGWPSDRYWIAGVKSPRGKTRCSGCNGEKRTSRQWDSDLGDYVEFPEPRPCGYCQSTGLVPSLHAVVMYGRELVWDPHPQRDMGHLGFVSGEQFGVADPSLLVPRQKAAVSDGAAR